MRNVALFVVTDGREDYLKQTLASLDEKCKYPFIQKLIINDSINPDFKETVSWLAHQYNFELINHSEKKGFAGVYNTAWANISPRADYVFSSEDDFLFEEEVNIDNMVDILNYNRNLVQVCLKRQPWNESEKEAGGIIEQWSDLYEEKNIGDIYWSEHRLFYSTNPCLTPRFVIDKGWAICEKSEQVMSDRLFENPHLKSCYYGKKFDAPRVIHIGNVRNGIGY